ncbi:MAG: glycine cleavage system aminomethyltransferase GcvT, partial [Leptospirales bacterium]
EIIVKGPKALDFLEFLTPNTVSAMQDGQVQYSAVLNAKGGLVDDVTIYRLAQDEYFIVSNASNYETVTKHFEKNSGDGVVIDNQSDQWHQLAIQGPRAEKIFTKITGLQTRDIAYFTFRDLTYKGARLRVSRTGYTGEDGFEIYSDVEAGVALWDALLEGGAADGLLPAGLGARDTLRLEAFYPLYGHELNADWTPVQSGIGWVAKEKATPYLGYDAVMDHKKNGAPGRVVGFILDGGGVPRDGYRVFAGDGTTELTTVLSGGHSPSLGKGIGSVYLPMQHAAADTPLQIELRNRLVPAHVHRGAFVKGSAGQKD